MAYLTALSMLLLLAAAPDKGALTILSQSGVDVVWEGVAVGRTDGRGVLVIRDIPVGEYSLTLSKEGYRRLRTRARVKPGETTVKLHLEALPAPAPPPVAEPEPPARSGPATPPTSSQAPTTGPEAAPPPPRAPAAGSSTKTPQQATERASEPEPATPPAVPGTTAGGQTAPETPADGASEASVAGTASRPDGPGEPEEADGAGPTGLLLLAAVLGLAALAAFVLARQRSRSTEPLLRPETLPGGEPATATGPATGATFLHDLREREESIASATRVVDGKEVIEVEVTEVEILEDESE